ncbi:LytR/AlgR family response regulator transcription factor [Garciella nitratireducens]|nr:LytTR family DNA-binding domain-containing protein [Garciella nitratireducens]RBP42737.1 LytTR family two component transcriptional regulator [Garciella nitratireducens]
MYIIAICEDDPIFLNALKPIIESRLRKLNTEYILDCFEDGESLVSEVVNSDVRYDAIFFDIALSGMSGIEAAKKIREVDESSLFIFITSLNDKVYQVFQFDTFHFIRKSYFEKEIKPVLDLLMKRLNRDCERFNFRTENGEITLRLNEIVYFERENRNVIVHTKNHSYIITNRSIKDLRLELGDKGFFEIYRGTLVNLSYGRYIKDSAFVLTTGKKLPISRRKLPEFKEIFFDNLQKV